MKEPNENDILETTLSVAEKGYPEAYQFLLNAYEESPRQLWAANILLPGLFGRWSP